MDNTYTHACTSAYNHIHTCMHTHMNTFTCTMHITGTYTCTSIPTHLYINRHHKHNTYIHTTQICTHTHTEMYSLILFTWAWSLCAGHVWSQSYFKVGSKRWREMYWLTLFFHVSPVLFLLELFWEDMLHTVKDFFISFAMIMWFFLRVHF